MKNRKNVGSTDFAVLGLIFATAIGKGHLSGKNGFRNMTRLLSKSTKLCLIAMLSVGLLACGEENISDLDAYVQKVKLRKKSRVPALPEVKSYATFTYNQANLRNPFQPQRSTRKARARSSGPTPDLKRSREALEQYPLDTLHMVGSLEQSGARWALIKTQDGTIFRVKRGSYMGQDNGRITKVTDTRVELKEIVPDGLGGWIKRKSTLGVNE